MGARIVLTSFGSFGDVYPYIGLALGLKSRGHRPVLAMPAYYRDTVEREGVDFHPVRPDLDPTDRETVRRIMDAARGTEYIVKDLILGSLRDTFHDLTAAVRGSDGPADLLVTHPVTFAAPLVAGKEGIPWVSTVMAPMSFFSPHDLPVFPPIPWAKRLERIPGAAAALVALSRRITRGWSRPVHELRRELGLPPGGDPIYEGQHSPHRVLGIFSPVLAEPQPDWPAGVRVTGAIPYNGPMGEHPLSPELEAFLEEGPAPLVFTLGTSAVGAAGSFYEVSVEAVRRLGQRAVLLVGHHPENHPRGHLPEGVMLQPFAPHAALFPRASAIVHQGGAGTLHQGLRAGRPTLVVPFAHDQPDNAWRVERLGVSRTLRPGRYTVARVEKELGRLLEDEGYRGRAEAVARRVRGERPVEDACDAIEEVLARRAASRSGDLP
jgi:rhamnosyltransferase subunit B